MEISKKSEMEMQTFVNLGIAVRDMIDTMYRDNKKGRKLALKLFTEGFNKTNGRINNFENKRRRETFK